MAPHTLLLVLLLALQVVPPGESIWGLKELWDDEDEEIMQLWRNQEVLWEGGDFGGPRYVHLYRWRTSGPNQLVDAPKERQGMVHR